MTVVTLENAIRATGASSPEADLLRRAWEAGTRGRGLVAEVVRSRCLRLLLEGPPGSGKTTAVQRLAGSLPAGLDVLDVDHDVSDPGSDRWRVWGIDTPPTILAPGASGGAALRRASQAAYDRAWRSVAEQTSSAAHEIAAGRSSGVVLDTVTTLVTFLMDTASRASEDLGADDDDRERQAAARYRGALYEAASAVTRQTFGLCLDGAWTAPPGPMVAACLAHAKPTTNEKREITGWALALGTQASNVVRGAPDFVLACGMDPSEKPGSVRLRYYAHVDESKAGGAKARWSQTTDPRTGVLTTDEAERGPALKCLSTLDVAGFVAHVVARRRALAFERLARFVGGLTS